MQDCTFCRIAAGELPAHVVYEDNKTIAFLDIAPIQRGHTLVVPKHHARNLFDIDPALAAQVTEVTAHIGPRLVAALGADGLNVTQNNEAAAGQVVFHYHVHLIPRWERETGFSYFGRRLSFSQVEMERISQSVRDKLRET